METSITPSEVKIAEFFIRILQRKTGTRRPAEPNDSFLKIIERNSKLNQNE